MNKCLDEEILQAFFDRELSSEMMEAAARHIASCATCTRAASEVEQENAVFRSALEPELSAGVPTEKLRARVTAALAELNASAQLPVEKTRAPWSQSFTGLFQFTPQRSAVFASVLAIVTLGSIFAAVQLRNRADKDTPTKAGVLSAPSTEGQNIIASASPVPSPTQGSVINPGPGPTQRLKRPRPVAGPAKEGPIRLIPGEQSYLRTIVVLDQGLKQNNQQSMPAATRAEYERNLKLVDYAIAATRSKAKRNPNDPDAAEFLFAAYQSKIDLLNTVSEARLAQH